MKTFSKVEKQENKQQPHFTTTWTEPIGKVHEIKVFGNVDKIEGFTYYQFIIDNEKTFTISKFDGQKWRMASGEENVLSEKLGEIIGQYDNLCVILKKLQS